MPLDPQAEKILKLIAGLNIPPLQTLEPAKAREITAQYRGKPRRLQPVPQVKNRTISTPVGDIPIRIYTPKGNAPMPVLVYFHGGGWVLGDLDAADSICWNISLKAECVVVSVDYRLAPEHKFPAALDDAYAALKWVVANAIELHIDPARVGVAGDSAGGNIAAALALMARDKGEPKLVYQLLMYPVIQNDFNTESYLKYASGFGLTRDEMIWYWQHYLADEADAQNHYASPILAEELSNLPPALIITGECDVLRDEGLAYGAKLQEAGVSVQFWEGEGMIHSFVGMAQVLDKGKDAIAYITTRLREVFANG
ncbi:alpha/beta hydrolase [Microseira wollei]|uniref:Lipase n=1 Tax=Microseira wollei NIES-4236 TaxID=2530354 RepID=A0AAV3X5R5_9CYAN|nr:alpha/beta hydrolase [Microseira wollei]GET35542.1 putative lipase [Microseira wollei NIES-4236]